MKNVEDPKFLHATRHGWSMVARHRVVTPSKYHSNVKGMIFVACDDGGRICHECLGEVDGVRDQYGPPQKFGTCYHCGLVVEQF
jgi:hypothetical protein